MSPGDTIEVDIWINDAPEDLISGGCGIVYDPALVSITNVVLYDTSNGGPWDASATQSFEVNPGVWIITLVQFGCVTPDLDGDVILAQVTFECQALGDADITFRPVPGFEQSHRMWRK